MNNGFNNAFPDTFKHILQTDDMDCGLTSAAMICNHFGIEMISGVKEKKDNLLPTSMLEISRILGMHNLKTLGARLSISELFSVEMPLILHWNGNHFVVLYNINRDWAYISDPAVGAQCFSLKEFSNWFSTTGNKETTHVSSINKWSNQSAWGSIDYVNLEVKGNCLLVER